MIQQVISFDLCGKMAHFRKYYSSSTAFSYTIPPKTTIQGIIASMLGLERDSYYDILGKWKIAVQIITPVRKVFQKMNYLKVGNINFSLEKEYSDVTGFDNRTQISVELVIPQNIREGILKYRVYIGIEDVLDQYFLKLKNCLNPDESSQNCIFGISLGSANMLGYYDNYTQYSNFSLSNNGESIVLKSTALTDSVELVHGDMNMIVEQDTFPLRMKIQEKARKNNVSTRVASEVKPLVYPLTESGMAVHIINNTDIFRISDSEESYYIAFV